MGRGKHLTHKEERVCISTKIPFSTYNILIRNRPVLENAADYVRELIYKDLKESKLLPNE